MANALEKLKKNSTIKQTSIITESKVYGKKNMTPTFVPMVNLGLSAKLDDGLTPGVTMLAGPSKHFKSMFALLMAGAYMEKYPDAALLFYDNEFGTPESYFEFFGIDMDRVVHTPVNDIEELKQDMVTQLSGMEKGDHVVVVIDSVGNIASRKEVEDALSGKTVADMTRAKQLKSFWRMVTPHLTSKEIPLIAINHSYQTIEMFSKSVPSGGTGGIYAADTIWMIGRQQNKKPGQDLLGYNFIININKSRFVKEGAKLPITVLFQGGIQKWSGMLDLAVEAGYVQKPSKGWYEAINPETGEILSDKKREADIINSDEFWNMILEKTNFKEAIESQYRIGGSSLELFNEEEIEKETDDEVDE